MTNEIYIGEGHFSHRWNPTMWSNPFKKGRHGNSLEVVLRYGQWVVEQDQLMGQLASLENCNLICDCAVNQLCHGDTLRALVWHEHRSYRGQGVSTSRSSRTVALLAGVSTSARPRLWQPSLPYVLESTCMASSGHVLRTLSTMRRCCASGSATRLMTG